MSGEAVRSPLVKMLRITGDVIPLGFRDQPFGFVTFGERIFLTILFVKLNAILEPYDLLS